jgi:hypothetical protein
MRGNTTFSPQFNSYYSGFYFTLRSPGTLLTKTTHMKTISKIGIVFLIAVLFSCSNRNKIEISSRNFGEEVQLQQNLVFTFNRPIVADSVLETWDTIPFIKFTPEVAGKFKWTSASEVGLFAGSWICCGNRLHDATSEVVSEKSRQCF